jgi:hypothetical protein
MQTTQIMQIPTTWGAHQIGESLPSPEVGIVVAIVAIVIEQ